MNLKGQSGILYQLEAEPLNKGGAEGAIYGIRGMSDKVVKVFHADCITQELERKLHYMCRRPPDKSVTSQVAWPADIVYGLNGELQGFVMRRLKITDALNDVYTYRPDGNISYRDKIIIAQNLCAVLLEIHRAGYVFGDFNPKNVGVNLAKGRECGHVAFLDADSYQFTTDGHTYRCKVCMPGYVAPELLEKFERHGTDFADMPLPTFTRETDNFILAIHIFQLLMNGFPPFDGILETQRASAASPGTGNEPIKRNSYCFKPGYRPQSVAVPPLSVLPGEIGSLFSKAFISGRDKPEQRPSAVAWHRALLSYENSLVGCPRNPAHMYRKELPRCPWCEADEKYNKILAGLDEPDSAPAPIRQRSISGPAISPPVVVTPPVPPRPVTPSNSNLNSGTPVPPRPVTPSRSNLNSGTSVRRPVSSGAGQAKKGRRRAKLKRRKKGIPVAVVFAIIACLAVGAYTALGRYQRSQYAQAEALLQAGNYSEAIDAFHELGNYSDAKEQAMDAMYQQAMALMAIGSYDEAAVAFEELSGYGDAEERILDAKYHKAEALLGAGNKPAAAMTFGALGDYQDARAQSFAIWDEVAARETISGGNTHAVGLKSDGTVVSVGKNSYGQCDVESWTDIIAVSAGSQHTVGLKADGTVVAAGDNQYGRCDVDAWTDIVAVSADGADTVGLKSDGTVVVSGYNRGKTDDWTNIVAVSVGDGIVGLKSDGTVVGTKNKDAISTWTDIVAIASKNLHTIGLKTDGTLVTAGFNYYGELSVDEWENIAAFSTGPSHTVGLKASGSLVVVGDYGLHDAVESWTNIVAVSVGTNFTIGLKADGTVITEGHGQAKFDVSNWTGIKAPGK